MKDSECKFVPHMKGSDKRFVISVYLRKTKDFCDGCIRCEKKPLRLKIPNICGDETVCEV